MKILTDCHHFDGYKPCKPHKRTGVHCDGCNEYRPIRGRILILKLGAAGEVIRCTPILRKLRADHPDAHIAWVTQFPDLVPHAWVDQVMPMNWETAEWVKARSWDLVLSLDKDRTPCALARQLDTRVLNGFTLDDYGRIAPASPHSRPKFATGVFDDLMKGTTKHYVEEIFEMCGWSFDGQSYILPDIQKAALNPMNGQGHIVGLNTGAGPVWPTRVWPATQFAELIDRLQGVGLRPMLLGGPDEHDLNTRLAVDSGAVYHGIRPLRQFLDVVNHCDVVVTSVTMALHMAIGLSKRIVLLNNIFNRHEFHLYGLGEILEPELSCLGCYKSSFDADCPVKNCMQEIRVEQVFDAIVRQASQIVPDETPSQAIIDRAAQALPST